MLYHNNNCCRLLKKHQSQANSLVNPNDMIKFVKQTLGKSNIDGSPLIYPLNRIINTRLLQYLIKTSAAKSHTILLVEISATI